MPLPSISSRIRAASSAHPILRRALASRLHAEMSELPDSLGLADAWRALGRVLLNCEVELYPRRHATPPQAGDMDRALEFAEMYRDAHNRGVMMRLRCEQQARRTRRAPRVIEVEGVEVRS